MLGHLTAAQLRLLLDYNPDTGVFTWRIPPHPRFRVGAVAGCLFSNGYRYIKIEKRTYKAHRLAWLYMSGEWPVGELDHKNTVRHDNRIANLRQPPSRSLACANTSKSSRNKSGYKGVSRCGNSWRAQIWLNGRRYHLGLFDAPAEAHAAYAAAAKRLHGEYARAAKKFLFK
jgi:HNH endonuclease/AP2 domain